jgi:hypothetical protein
VIVRRRTATLLALIFFVAAALLATYPLILSPATKIAGGLGDPLLNAIVLAWDADRARHAFHGFWDAPFLFPHRHTLAYAEPLISVAIFTSPIEWLSGNPVLAYNVAYIGSYALAGFGMFLLARDLWGRTDAALLAGLAFALTPYRQAQTTHLQVLLNGWMPIGLWALHRYFSTGARRWMAAFAVVFVLQGLSNGYYFYFFLIAVAVMAAVELAAPRLPRARVIGDFAAAGAAIFAAIAPIFLVYYRLQRDNGFVRAAGELGGLSATLSDYFKVAAGAWTWGGLIASGAGERQLFHGLVVLTFAFVGACTIARPGAQTKAGSWTRSVVTYALMAIVAVWLSMGPGALRPYGLLYRFVPGFNGLRVPARLSAVVIVALAALAGAGFAWIFARLPKAAAATLAVVLGCVIVVEGQHGIGLSDVLSRHDRSWDRVAYDWMKAGPPGAALELNITPMDDFQPYTMVYQLNTLWHGHPIVNGYSGWKSMLQEMLGAAASPLNEPGSVAGVLRGLRAIGVRYVFLHDDTYPDADARERLVSEIRAAHDQIAEEHRWQGVWAWRLADIAPRPALPATALERLDPRTFDLQASHQRFRVPYLFDGDIDTRWLTGEYQDGSEWIEIRLPHATDVARVQFLSSPRSQLAYPRGVAIDSIDVAGVTRTLFADAIVDRLVEAVALNEQQAPVNIDLPANETTMLRIRQTGHASAWWVIDEMNLWKRK